jgi:predicted RecB family nuclease
MSANKTPMLSKSRFLSGLQCYLCLWHSTYNPGLATDVSPVQQAIFDTGHKVGELATRLYPGGVLIEEKYFEHEKAVQTTIKAIQNPNIKSIYEAAFIYNEIRIRADILERADNGKWNLIEVKSSASVKEIHIPDVAIQYYVLQGSGLEVNRAYLLHINNQYVYDGNNLDLEGFFSSSDVTYDALSLQNEISVSINELKEMLNSSAPPLIQPSRHCKSPYTCKFLDYCTRNISEHRILELSGISQKKLDELETMGIEGIMDVPDSYPLTELQERIRECVVSNNEFISKGIEDELKNVEYPAHFLDFETVSPAIPRYAGTKPYQTIPFQWSDHILTENGILEHKEYLCNDDKDPREEFADTLLATLKKNGTVFIYTTYEKGIIEDLAVYFPQLRSNLLLIIDRFKDLCAIIKKHFYHPEFHGSFSLKSVLPAIVPDMDYGELVIQEGNQASLEYLQMIDPSISSDEKERIKKELLKYCGYDTLAMVKIRDELIKRCSMYYQFF